MRKMDSKDYPEREQKVKMHIRELYWKIVDQLTITNTPRITEEQFLELVTLMQIKNILTIDNGIVRRNDGSFNCQ